jgi:hypothetical protein
MKHFGIVQWVDFTRGVISGSEAERMREHLSTGCRDCAELEEFCNRLAGICRTLTTEKVPEHAVQQARSIFQAKLLPQPKRKLRIPVELLFDSFLMPAPAGLRASWQIGWQALYRAGDCSLDLRVEPELNTCRAAIIGQISNHETPETEMADVPVYLKSGKVIVAQTRANRFGEFQMEYEQQKKLHLHVYLDGGSKAIQVPLKDLSGDSKTGEDRLKTGLAARKRQ